MRIFLATSLFLLLATATIYPQNDNSIRIKEIRDYYSKVANEIEKIEKSEEAAFQSELAVNELVVNKLNKSWPAVGNYSVVYRFYYKQAGEEHYPSHLVMVRKTIVSAARKHYEEFLFSDKGGLIYSIYRENSGEEHRLYFSSGSILGYVGKGDIAVRAAMSAQASLVRDYKQLFTLSIQ